MSTLYIRYPTESGGGGGGVTSLNSITGDITLVAGTGISITPSGEDITITNTSPGSGTVTSVGLALPMSLFSISGSPVTSSGTLTGSLITQAANSFFAAPNGSSGTPSFRSIVAADLPNLSGTYVTQSEVGAANGVAALDSSSKIPIAYLPNSVLQYEGTWDPSTNTPTLQDATGTAGFVYWVSAAATGPITGLNNASMHNFQIGDLVIYNGSQWELTTPAAGVQSVNGLQGVVVVNAINQLTGDITAGPASGSQSVSSSLVATSNSTLVTLSALSLPYSQITGAPAAITALTGDVTASGPGSSASTLATVNSNVGSFTNANITVNAKGLITAASSGSSAGGNFGAALWSVLIRGDTSNFYSLTSGTYADFTVTNTPTIYNFYGPSGFTATSIASGNLPGVTLTVPNNGTLKITASLGALELGDNSGLQLVDGSNNQIVSLNLKTATASEGHEPCLVGYYDVVAGTSYTFKLQGKTLSGTLQLGGETGLTDFMTYAIEYVK